MEEADALEETADALELSVEDITDDVLALEPETEVIAEEFVVRDIDNADEVAEEA